MQNYWQVFYWIGKSIRNNRLPSTLSLILREEVPMKSIITCILLLFAIVYLDASLQPPVAEIYPDTADLHHNG